MKFSFSNKKFWIGAVASALLVGIYYFGTTYLDAHPSTDDAYVQANTINIAPQVTGPVAAIFVKDHERVEKNKLLFQIDPVPFQIAVEKAQASVAEQRATLLLAQQNATRILDLVKIAQESKAAGDLIQSKLDTAKAELAIREAQLAQAKLDLAHTRIFAPNEGIITQFTLRPGNNVIANNTLFMIVEQNNFWVDANFKETQLAKIRVGQPAKIKLDMFPGQVFQGVVEAISSASGSVFSLLPPENASGNWVKVTQRIPVKIIISDPNDKFPLRAGATATITIDTTK